MIHDKVYPDRSEIDLNDATIRIKNCISVESYDEKTEEIITFWKILNFQTNKDIKSKFW